MKVGWDLEMHTEGIMLILGEGCASGYCKRLLQVLTMLKDPACDSEFYGTTGMVNEGKKLKVRNP